jgi:hypothetical protein
VTSAVTGGIAFALTGNPLIAAVAAAGGTPTFFGLAFAASKLAGWK